MKRSLQSLSRSSQGRCIFHKTFRPASFSYHQYLCRKDERFALYNFREKTSGSTISTERSLDRYKSQGSNEKEDAALRSMRFDNKTPTRLEAESAGELVERLLKTTEDMVLARKSDGNSFFEETHLIAFSGGVDSSLVAALVHRLLSPSRRVKAVLGISPAVPADQVNLAETVAEHIGVALEKVETTEGQDERYIANTGQACLACKTNLYSTLQAIVNNHKAEHKNDGERVFLYNGTNADDVKDPTRLGLIAADRFHVLSPLRGATKTQVRLASKFLGLPNWNYAASPCLRSRLALGVQATEAHLRRIERAERFVREQLEVLDETSNLRVRLLSKNRACIEVDRHILCLLEEKSEQWASYFCGTLNFASVHTREFRSGSVATQQET